MASRSDAEEALSAFAARLNEKSVSSRDVSILESKLDGPDGVVTVLLTKLWLPQMDPSNSLSILVHLVETYPQKYTSIAASAIRLDIEHKFDTTKMDTEQSYEVWDAIILALAKLLVAPNSDTQTGIATDAHAALLALCKFDKHEYHKSGTCQKLFQHLGTLWKYLQQQQKDKLRESSTAQMRIAALMIDVSLLGGKEIALAVSDDSGGIMNKLLHLALDFPNNDPLLQMTALDALEGLAAESKNCPMTNERAEFLLGNDRLHIGLLYLIGSSSEDVEFDTINGYAALRLITEICRMGISSSNSVIKSTKSKFYSLLESFQEALHALNPRGESERLSYIYAVSSLVASCATSTEEMSKAILQNTTLLHGWLSLLGRSSQPKLKSAILSSLSQVIEPSIWQDKDDACKRPSDYISLSLYHALGEANNQKDPTECVLASAKSPFVEERLGAYNVLRAMSSRGCCVRMLLLYKGDDGSSIFVEWLLNQDNESTNEGRQAKYKIVESLLADDNNIEGLISTKAFREMQLWIKRGPAHTTTVPWDLATE
eukprot:CAMPEP_0201695768 /NCGR_PEP_ID=MMETSP0578-20130828/7621_1 /ASSEMBLY_ACC=CAM_ASM_000663 /TAXON_ID=267565 /ORGANISM="Skeletonema grethea, Strain CCMP 1804" /LENGTH=543 /DNA_ID=CAMNT_0048181667 /DNA_START=44 /DNA_END=1675 /DNA_ORIENTATION=+